MEMGAPVSMTSKPRLRPSVLDMETVRTQLSPRCCCTSSVSLIGLVLDLELDGQRVVDGGQFVREFDIHHRADDLNNFAFIHR